MKLMEMNRIFQDYLKAEGYNTNYTIENDFYEVQGEFGQINSFFIYSITGTDEKKVDELCEHIDKKIIANSNPPIDLKPILITENQNTILCLLNKIQSKKTSKKFSKDKKNTIKNFILNSTVVIRSVSDKHRIRYDNNFNFLENNLTNDTSGIVINASLKDLVDLYDLKGDVLFNKNIRIGLQNNDLKDIFGMYIKNELVKMKIISDDYGNSTEISELFWFKHNGITIYTKDFNQEKLYVEIPLNGVSVINGAQTISTFHNVIFNLINKNDFDLEEYKNNNKSFDLEKTIYEIIEKIKVKCTLITLREEHIKDVTLALNNQIAIKSTDLYFQNMEKLNKKLNNYGIRILRPGERTVLTGFSSIEFLKSIAIINKLPGVARNLSRKQADEMLKKIDQKNINEEFANKLKIFKRIDSWWKNLDLNGNIEPNTNNYFKAFILDNIDKTSLDSLSDADFKVYFDLMIEKITKISAEANSNDFKKNDLYNQLVKQLKETSAEVSIDQKHLEHIKQLLIDGENNNKNFRHAIINKYLINSGINIKFRTISMNEKGTIYESFYFDSNTFSAIYEKNQKKYVDSDFKEAVHQKYKTFIIIESDSKISDVKFIDIDFSKFEDKAELVFKKTIEAFEEGDSNIFVKESEDLGFHIRPKAKNSLDTFMFKDEGLITKRTFWANKKTLQEILMNLK